MSVTRYDFSVEGDGVMNVEKHPRGDYVEYDEYAELEKRLSDIQEIVASAIEKLNEVEQ